MTENYSVKGSCLCGSVRFEITAPPESVGYCHCTRCQKRTGTGSSVGARVHAENFRFLAGEELVKGWRHADGGAEKCFCTSCGGHLFSRSVGDPVVIGVRMAAFDGDVGVTPSYRQYVAYAASWEPIPDDGLPRYPESRFA